MTKSKEIEVLDQLPSPQAFHEQYVNKHKPVIFRNSALTLVPRASALLSSSANDEGEDGLKRLRELVGESGVDVSCVQKGSAFSGDPALAESAHTSFRAFLSFFHHASSSRKKTQQQGEDGGHQGELLDDLDLYLAQCPIYERPSSLKAGHKKARGGGGGCASVASEGGRSAPLAGLYPHIDLPEALVKSSEIVTINLWMGLAPTCTTLHYDSNHNLLVVFQGAKQVHLYSPAMTSHLSPRPAYLASANHSTLPINPQAIFTSPKFPQAEPMVAMLGAGDVLYLPQGWWHQVDSKAQTIALNYWFEGFVEQVLDSTAAGKAADDEGGQEEEGNNANEMLSFYLRSVVQRAVDIEKKKTLMQAKKYAWSECRRRSKEVGTEQSSPSRKRSRPLQEGEESVLLGKNEENGQKKDERLPWKSLLHLAVAEANGDPDPRQQDGDRGRRKGGDHALLWNALLTIMPLEIMMILLPPLAKAVSTRWVELMKSTGSTTVEAMTLRWEQTEEEEDEEEGEKGLQSTTSRSKSMTQRDLTPFFAAIFQSSSSEEEGGKEGGGGASSAADEIKEHLMEGKEEFSRQALMRLLF